MYSITSFLISWEKASPIKFLATKPSFSAASLNQILLYQPALPTFFSEPSFSNETPMVSDLLPPNANEILVDNPYPEDAPKISTFFAPSYCLLFFATLI